MIKTDTLKTRSLLFALLALVCLGFSQAAFSQSVCTNCNQATDGDYTVLTFTGNGSFTPPQGVESIEYLVVGGGGGGGGGESIWVFFATLYHGGGGGGAGQVLVGDLTVQQQSYLVSVGSGGNGGASGVSGASGGQSSIGNLVLAAGGAGGTGGDGGAGGSSGSGLAGGSGGTGLFNNRAGGGGGGSAAAGNNASGNNGGTGGAGTGGYGQGGDGGDGGATATGADAVPTTGNGGEGGSGARAGGGGSSGIVIIRYLTPAAVYYSRVSGLWSAPATWNTTSCNNNTAASTIPHQQASVVICGGDHVTLDQNATIAGLEFDNGAPASLTHENGYELTVGADGVDIGAVSTGSGSKAWNINNGSAVVNGNLELSGGNNPNRQSLVNLIDGTLDINGNLSFPSNGDRAAIVATGEAQLFVSGSVAANVQFLPGEESTFTYDGLGDQVVRLSDRVNYHNLVLAGGGNKNHSTGAGRVITGTTTVNAGVRFNNQASLSYQGDFINAGETVATATQTYQGNFINNGSYSTGVQQNYHSDFTNNGTFNAGGAAHNFIGSRTQVLTGTTIFTVLAVNNSDGIVINGDVLVEQQLHLTAGVVTTGGRILRVAQPGGWSGINRVNGWVAGNLALYMPTGWQSYEFPVGDATVYRPISVSNMNVSSAGYLVASVSQSPGDHPQISSAELDQDASVNRWWSLESEGVVSSAYSATFSYLNADMDSGANPSEFEIQRFSGGWFDVAVTSRSVNGGRRSIQGSAITGFGDFAIAEPGAAGPGPLPDAIIEYRMDEDFWTTGSNDVRDSSGNNRHGLARGGVTTADVSPALPGDPGTCRYGEFDGDDDYIEVPGLSTILNRTASLAFWIRTTQTGTTQSWSSPGITGVELEGLTDDIFWGWLDNGGRIGLSVGDSFSTKSTVAINNGAWRHVVLSRDHLAGQYRIYVDGALDASGNIAAGVIGTPYTSIGRIQDTSGSHEYFEGDLDELRVYDRMLTLAEVQALRAATHPCSDQLCPAGIAQPGLIGSYYNNRFLSGEPTGTWVDQTINYDWAGGAPGVSGVEANNFSIEWTGVLRVTESGNYRFQTRSDDGVRLRLDGNLIIDQWNDHAATDHSSGDVYLSAGGVYPINLQFYENGGEAVIQLRWRPPSAGSYGPIPAGPVPDLGAGLYSCVINTVSYYGISHSGSGLTCEAEEITITAYDAGHNPIAPPENTVITLSTTPAGATWAGGNTATFHGEVESVTKYLRQTTPVSALNIDVSDGITTENALYDPDISFADVGLRFYGNTNGDGLPNQVAGIPYPTTALRVVETDSDTGACVPRLQNTTRPVELAYECRNPAACSAGQTLSLNGNAVSANNGGASIAYSTVTANFDAAGFAVLPFVFSDVGLIRLHGQLNLPEEDEHAAVSISGSSSEFVVKPYTLAISVDSANPGTTASGSGFIAAGESFSAQIDARNANGDITPAFGRESTPAGVEVSAQLLWPSGGSLGTLHNHSSFTPIAPGVYENTTLSWDQVGSISLSPKLVNNDYLDAGDVAVAPEPSGTVGRFYPYEFRLLNGGVSNSCGSFTYMGHAAFSMDYSIEALGYNTGVVSNYDSSLGYPVAQPAYIAENNDNGAALDNGRIEPGIGATWGGGVLSLYSGQASIARESAPDGPYSVLRLGVQLSDGLDGRLLAGLDMDADSSGDCTSGNSCTAVALDGEINVRYGRLRLSSGFGPESADLPASLSAEFWDGERWLHNSADSCTRIGDSEIIFNESDSLSSNPSIPVGAGSTSAIFHNYSGNEVHFSAGEALRYFTAPGLGNIGEFTMKIAPGSYPWLTFDWNGDGVHDDGPVGRYSFGSYRGHDRIIYWREVLD